ncbi:MAG: hypothetical protein U0556_09865 [Dehalococcoidia bacterium]
MADADVRGLSVADTLPKTVSSFPLNGGGHGLAAALWAKRTSDGLWVPVAANADGTLATSPTCWWEWVTTNATLAGGASYTSSVMSSADFTRVVGHVGSNVAGTLKIQTCIDSSFTAGRFHEETIAYPDTEMGVSLGTVQAFDALRTGAYCRLVFTNGGSAQGWFVLYAARTSIAR